MIKGCQKKMVVVRNIASDLFDEAYFIMKDDDRTLPAGRDEMMTEADRIVSASLSQCQREGDIIPNAAEQLKKRAAATRGNIITFALGFAAGIVPAVLFIIFK